MQDDGLSQCDKNSVKNKSISKILIRIEFLAQKTAKIISILIYILEHSHGVCKKSCRTD